jgi:hypothetical protein
MSLFVEEDEAFNPVEVSLFGADAFVLEANTVTDLFKKWKFFHGSPYCVGYFVPTVMSCV